MSFLQNDDVVLIKEPKNNPYKDFFVKKIKNKQKKLIEFYKREYESQFTSNIEKFENACKEYLTSCAYPKPQKQNGFTISNTIGPKNLTTIREATNEDISQTSKSFAEAMVDLSIYDKRNTLRYLPNKSSMVLEESGENLVKSEKKSKVDFKSKKRSTYNYDQRDFDKMVMPRSKRIHKERYEPSEES